MAATPSSGPAAAAAVATSASSGCSSRSATRRRCDGWDAEEHPASVKTGRTNDEVKDGVPPRFEQPPPGPDVAPDLSLAREERQPDFVPPMMATLTDAAFDDDDWLYEIKWDGYRVEAVVSDGRARIWTRNRIDAATYFPDLAGPRRLDRCRARRSWTARWWPSTRRGGRTSAGCRRGPGCAAWRWPRAAPIRTRPRLTREEREAIPLAYMVFDLLHLDGRSLVDVPLEDRKRLLRRVLRPDGLVRYASHVVGDGVDFTQAAADEGTGGDRGQAPRSAPTSRAGAAGTG